MTFGAVSDLNAKERMELVQDFVVVKPVSP